MSERAVRTTLIVVALFELAAGALIWISPGTYFDKFGNYGVENDHFLRYLAAALIAPGIGLLIAAERRSWRVPLLVVGAILNALLAIQHLFDVGEATSTARGLFDAAAFAAVAAGAAYLGRECSLLEAES